MRNFPAVPSRAAAASSAYHPAAPLRLSGRGSDRVRRLSISPERRTNSTRLRTEIRICLPVSSMCGSSLPRTFYVYQKDCRHHLLSGTRSLSLFSYYQLFFHHADSGHTYPSKISMISMFRLNQPSSPFMPLSHCSLPSCQETPHTLHPRPCTQRSESVSDPGS